MVLDRTVPPVVHDVEDINVPIIDSTTINGINLYSCLESNTGTFKIELLTKGSQLYASTAALSQLSFRMLNEGTRNKSSTQLAESIDSLGSFFEITPGFDYSSVSIFGLAKYFQKNIQLLSEVIYESKFDHSNLESLKTKELDKLKLNLEKGSYISSINLRKSLFGSEHAYGKHLRSSEINSISVEQIKSFHSTRTCDFDIYLSGNLPKNYKEIISKHFHSPENHALDQKLTLPKSSEDTFHKNEKLIQSSIKIGKRLFNRDHPDYFSFIVTNELLGGFFGSRLMKNIREEKGLTYGIHSALYPLLHSGYFLISTDVKAENQHETVDEIIKEINLLRNELVSVNELETVKNYMIGVFTNSFSSPFASIDKFKTLNSQGISLEFYQHYVSKVRNIDPKMIIDCANQFLSPESLTHSIAGK